MNGSYADLAHYEKHQSQFSSPNQRMVCTRGCWRLHSFILSLLVVNIGISKRKRIITLVLSPNREEYLDFMFPVMCAHN